MKGNAKFNFDPHKTYTVKLKKNNWWWLLLLLLPLILLINFHKHIPYHVVDEQNNTDIAFAVVDAYHTDRQFIGFSPFGFFTHNQLMWQDTADINGKGSFDIRYSLFSKIFYTKKKITFVIHSLTQCFDNDTITTDFFKLSSISDNIFKIKVKQELVNFTIVDSMDNELLPDANVHLYVYSGKQTITLTDTSDARGIASFYIPSCADSIKIETEKHGYKTVAKSGLRSNFAMSDDRKIALPPITTPLVFFVKNKYTKKPVPNAKATVIFDNTSYTVTTNTDGIGKAVIDSVSILSKFKIQVNHPAYHDTITPEYVAENFIKMNDEQRTIYIRPKPGSLTFKNIDKDTKEALPGVLNEVFVNGKKVGDFISNSDGEFDVPNLNPKDKISITSSKEGYFTNSTDIRNKRVSNLKTEKDRTIELEPKLMPRNVKPPKDNCRAHFSGTLLADFYIDNHISYIYKPDKYGEYVGAGEYPSNKVAFPNAVAHTFDAIAVDAGTRVIIYSKPNFQGRVVLDVTGPALINNVKWKNDSRISNINTKKLKDGLQSEFPPSCRRWSNEDMNKWSNGSVKVICTQ